MKKTTKTIVAIIVAAIMIATCLAVMTACGDPKAAAIKLTTPPTVTSKYGEDLKIGDDGVLAVLYEDKSRGEVKITLDMIDQTGFKKDSIAKQTLKINYGGQAVEFTFALKREVKTLAVKTAPTISSVFTDMPLDIADDGVLTATFADGGSEDVPITLDMLSGYDITSSAEQDVTVTYGGKTTTFKMTLVYEEIDDTGEAAEYVFQAENAQLAGQAKTEQAFYDGIGGSQPQYDADNKEVWCVAALWQYEEGGKITFTINSSKRTRAKIALRLSCHADIEWNWDKMTTMTLNGKVMTTNITIPATSTEGGSWWKWNLLEAEGDFVLSRGVNTIEIATNTYRVDPDFESKFGMKLADSFDTAGGRNVDYIKFTTTGELSAATAAS